MAAAWFNRLADASRMRAISAGTRPASRVHPVVVEAMAEVGIDLSRTEPVLLTDALAARAAVLVTMGCGDACPVVPGALREDWPLEDPQGRSIDEVRSLRDQIRERVVDLIARAGERT